MSIEVQPEFKKPKKMKSGLGRFDFMLAAGGLLGIGFLYAMTQLTDGGMQENQQTNFVMEMSLDEMVLNGLSGAFMIDGDSCPVGGREPKYEEDVAQDYLLGDAAANAPLIAISPQVVYDDGDLRTAYCGPYYGSNGIEFEGLALIIEGDSTIVAPPSKDGDF